MKTLDRKKAQRRVNHVIREINDGILKDNLWNGRFYIRQLASWIRPWQDNSGLTGIIHCEFIDLKSGFTKEYWFDLIDFEKPFVSHIWWTMNSFITEEAPVWGQEISPYDEPRIQYRKDNSAPAR